MKIYVFKKIALIFPMLFGITLITFTLTNALPGDPVYSMVGERASPETIEKIRKEIGADKGVVRQYIGYVSLLLTGEMGRSYYTNRKVLDEIITKLPNTLRLAAGAMCLAVPFGIFLGLISAIRKNSISDRLITFVSHCPCAPCKIAHPSVSVANTNQTPSGSTTPFTVTTL